MSPDTESKARSKATFPKHLQTTLRPSPHRTTSQVSSISVEASLPEQESSSSSRTLLSKDPKYHRQRPHSQSYAQSRGREIADSSSTVGTAGKEIPKIQRTLSAPGTPGRATPTSAHQPSTASTRSPSTYSLSLQALGASVSVSGSGSGSGTGTSTPSPSRKGKEKAVEDVEVDDVEVEGELVIHDGDATKGLRELVRRTTIGEGPVGHHPPGQSVTDGTKGLYIVVDEKEGRHQSQH